MDEQERILSTEYSLKFDELRKNRMIMSHYKYGHVKENATNGYVKMIPTLLKRLEAYDLTGNTEFLCDIANFAMMEFMYPQHPRAHFTPTDSDKSPGLVGMSIKQMEEFKRDNE